jgi:pilus assembly protein Flp/PilA
VLLDAARDAILKYNSRTCSYSFKTIRYYAGSIQNNPPLTTDFFGKELVNCIGYSFLKLSRQVSRLTTTQGRLDTVASAPRRVSKKTIPGLNLRQQADLEALQMTTLVKFFKDESGATAVEYGLIAAGISVSIIAVVHGLGAKLATTFTTTSTGIK